MNSQHLHPPGRALEMAQRHEELRSDRQAELQLAQEDFDRRLEELKTSLRREAEHARGVACSGGWGVGGLEGGRVGFSHVHMI